MLIIRNLNLISLQSWTYLATLGFCKLGFLTRVCLHHKHDRTEKSCTASTSPCPIQSLRKLSQGLVWDNRRYLQCMIFPSCHVLVLLSFHYLLSEHEQRFLVCKPSSLPAYLCLEMISDSPEQLHRSTKFASIFTVSPLECFLSLLIRAQN